MAITATTPDYDPNIPVYAAPDDVGFTPVETEQKDSASYVDPALATVEGRTAGLLASGNALTELAKTENARAYGARGLLNSGNAVAGGTLAAMKSAVDMATPDAALYGNLAQSAQKADQDTAANNQVAALENQKNINNASLSAALTTQEQLGNVELQKLSDNAQMRRVEVDNQWKSQINLEQMSAQDRTALLGVSEALGAELTGGIERLLRDTNIPDKTSAIQALMTNYQAQMTTAASIVSLNLSWS